MGRLRRTFFADEMELERADLVAAHVGLLVLIAEDVQLDLVDPDAVLGLAGEPVARGGMVGYWEDWWENVSMFSSVEAGYKS